MTDFIREVPDASGGSAAVADAALRQASSVTSLAELKTLLDKESSSMAADRHEHLPVVLLFGEQEKESSGRGPGEKLPAEAGGRGKGEELASSGDASRAGSGAGEEGEAAGKAEGDADKLRRLSESQDVEGLVELARNARSPELAERAITQIYEIGPDNLMEILRDLARGDSYAAGAALTRLLDLSADPEDVKLLKKRWEDGDILRLWKDGKMQGGDVLRALRDGGMLEPAVRQALTALADKPDLLGGMCKELLSSDSFWQKDVFDKLPMFMQRSLFELSPELKLKVVEKLIETKPTGYEKTLLVLNRTEAGAVREEARAELERLWTTEAQPAGSERTRSRLLVGDVLQDFINKAGKLEWPKDEKLLERYKEYRRMASDVAETKERVQRICDVYLTRHLDPEVDEIPNPATDNWNDDKKMAELLKDDPELLRDYEKVRADEKRVEEKRAELDRSFAPRHEALKDSVADLAKRLGLPVPEVQFAESLGDARGTYQAGTGQIRILETLALSDRPLGSLLETAAHEVAHLEQDTFMVRALADELGIDKTADETTAAKLKKIYRQRVGSTLTDEFLKAVLDVRDGVRLADGEKKRALELMAAFKDRAQVPEREQFLERAIDSLTSVKKGLEVPCGHIIIYLRKNHAEWIKGLLHVKKLPEELSRALTAWSRAERDSAEEQTAIQELSRLLQKNVSDRLTQFKYEKHRIYRKRFHEVESHEVGERARFFASAREQAEVGTAASTGDLTPVDRLDVAKGLLSEDVVGRFHAKINDMATDLRAAPEHARTRLRNAVIALLKGEGIEDKSLSKDRLEFVFDKDVKGTQVEYFSGQGDKAQKVIRKGSEFFLADGTTRVDPGSVRTKATMPEALLRGNVGELSRQVYLVLMEQTNSGANDAADRAGMREFVTRSLSKHVSLPDEAGTVRAGHERANVSQLPSAEPKPVEIAITDKGVNIAGVDRELSCEDVWRKRVEDLKAELDKEKKKEGSERSEDRIRQLTAELAKEQAFLDRLSNSAHPEHGKTVELAKDRLRNFSAREADIERLSRERGGGMRGRLVALTILASAYIGHEQQAQASRRRELP